MGDWGLGKFITFVIIFIIAIMAFIINVKKLGIDVNTGLPIEINTGTNTGSNTGTNTGSNTHNSNPSNVSAKTYSDLETQVELATKSHIAKYYPNLSQGDNFVIMVNTLIKDGRISSVRDVENSSIKCNGYTTVYNDGKTVAYNAYLICGNNYTTNGYDERLQK